MQTERFVELAIYALACRLDGGESKKVEHLLGMSLDRMNDYLSWPADGLDPCRLAAQTQAVCVIAMVATKVGVEAAQRDRERILTELARDLRVRDIP
jgi:hypothetical protein